VEDLEKMTAREDSRMAKSKYPPDLRGLGSFVRQRRLELHLTQQELADRVGYVQERVSLLESGKYGLPSLPALADLAHALETPLPRLLIAVGYSEDMVSPNDAPSSADARNGGDPSTIISRVRSLRKESARLTAGIEHLQVRLGTAGERMQAVDGLREQMAERQQRMQTLMVSLQVVEPPAVPPGSPGER
jgi:DNA-binding XRE family transcriptional regulator